MDKKLRKSINLCVEIMNREMASKGGNLVTSYKLAFAVCRKRDA